MAELLCLPTGRNANCKIQIADVNVPEFSSSKFEFFILQFTFFNEY